MSSYTERQARIEKTFSAFRDVNPRHYRTLSDKAQIILRPLSEIGYRSIAHNNPVIDRARLILIGKSYKMNYASPIIHELSAKCVL